MSSEEINLGNMDNRKEKIYTLLKKLTNSITVGSELSGFDAIYIAQSLGIHRTGSSRELNELVREEKIIKILGKPVLYLEKGILQNKFNVKLYKCIFANFEELNRVLSNEDSSDYVVNEDNKTSMKNLQTSETKREKFHEKIFDEVIGGDDSLKKQIRQAKAAILYPPNGLHTLILGPTGVGKTTFAEIMYKYAVEAGRLNNNAPYVIFNCADYSENPQLLLSHLFGHVKGAFTGADKDKKGLVDAANGGILFLDEVHRLSSEGQEMLFSLMDRGAFRRLGESENSRKANVFIIAATTEDVNKSILKTFLRRIPCIINLPSLADRSLNDRFKFIQAFFSAEANKIKLPLIVSAEIIRLLLLYDCPGNIGQLKNDIRLICANSFAETIINNNNKVYIGLAQVSSKLKDFIFTLDEKRSELTKIFGLNAFNEITFDSSADNKNIGLENKLISETYKTEEDFYENILKKSREYIVAGKSVEDIRENINIEIEQYFNKKINLKKEKTDHENTEILSKIVSNDILDAVNDIFDELKDELNFSVDRKLIYSLSLHMETLIAKMKSGNQRYNSNIKIDNTSYEYKVSEKIKEKLEEKLHIKIPNEEAIIIAMFLSAIKETKKNNYIGILVIAHGQHTATSMANVANQLLGVDHAKAIDMPLEESVTTTYDKVLSLVKEIDHGRGVLLLVDMGSLTTFSQMITDTTGILAGTIKMVSTPMVIEATRKSMMPNISLKTLIKEVNSMSQYIGNSVETSEDKFDFKSSETLTQNLDSFLCLNEEKFLNVLEQTTTFLNTRKTYNLLNQSLNQIINKLNIESNDGLTVKFMFHCVSMLERVIKNGALEYKNFREVKNSKIELFNIVKSSFFEIEKSFGITIPDSELTYIVELVDIQINAS